MKTWVEKYKFILNITDFTGLFVQTVSEVLAILPYVLRSLRVKKMFQARDSYYDSNKIPRTMIKKWSEKRIIKILIIILTTLCALELSAGLIS